MRMHSWLVGIFSYLIAATAMQADPTADYLAARDQHIAAFKNLSEKDQNGPRAQQSLAHVEQLLKAAVLPWSGPGFSGPGFSGPGFSGPGFSGPGFSGPGFSGPGFSGNGFANRSCFDDDALGFSVPNGLVYATQTSRVFVSNRALVMDWLRKNNKISPTQTKPVFPAAFSDESLWTVSVGCDSGASLRKMIDIPRPAGASSVTAALVEFSTGGGFLSTPDTVVAAVVRGDRIFMASTVLTEALPPDPDCQKKQVRREKELAAGPYPQSAQSSDAVSYQICFDKNLGNRPVYAKVVKKAEALVNILH